MATAEDYFSRSWSNGAPEAVGPPLVVTQDPTTNYYCPVPPPAETTKSHDQVNEQGLPQLHDRRSNGVPAQRARPPSGSNPRKFHKRTRSGTKVMLASSTATSTAASKPKQRRKHRDARPPPTSHAKSTREPSSSRPALTPRSRSNSSTLYRRPRGDQHDRIRRPKFPSNPSQDRVRSLVSPSLLSVLSTLTGTSSSSSSNMTVTPSTTRSSHHSQRDPQTHRRRPSFSRSGSREFKERLQSKRELPSSQINVFDFLDREAPADSWNNVPRPTSVHFVPYPKEAVEQPWASRGSSTLEDGSTKDSEDRPRKNPDENRNDGFFSDSGISIDGESPQTRRRGSSSAAFPPLESVKDESKRHRGEAALPFEQSFAGAPATAPYTYSLPNSSAQPMTATPHFNSMQPAQPAGYGPFFPPPSHLVPSNHEGVESRRSLTPSQTTVVGYELLASKLSAFASIDSDEQPLVPIYRRFEQLHHRVLLHLQDEISELEENLEELDEQIGRIQREANGSSRPASRREDAAYRDRLCFQRTDILGQICVKLDKYDQALDNYRSMVKKTETAKQEDVSMYKAWLEEKQPIASHEARFLDHRPDLIGISSRAEQLRHYTLNRQSPRLYIPATSQRGSSEAQPIHERWRAEQLLMIGPLAAMLATFVAFTAVTSLWTRFVAILTFTAAGCVSAHLSELRIDMASREVWLGVAFYIAVMAALAGTHAA